MARSAEERKRLLGAAAGVEKRQAVEDLINKIRTSLENNSPVSPDEVAVLAAYRPLHIFPWAEELPHESWADDMKEVITGQIENFKVLPI